MYRQSPSRSQRSRGIKVKHVLQICFLLAICFWLIYQVKHSHDKRKEFDESDLKNSQHTQTSSEVVKLGRKDLHPRVEETTNTKQDEEAEEENVGEEVENKHEEEEHAEDNKSEEKDDEGTGVGDDEIDEHEEEKSQAEEDREEDVTEEEKENEEGDVKENEENDSEDNGGQFENDSFLEERDDDEIAHEAREELYKADDASSAVTHENEAINGKNEDGSSENSNELAGIKVVENENFVNYTDKNNVGENTTGSKFEDRQMIETGGPLNTTANEDLENVGSKSDERSLSLNSTLIGISSDNQERMNSPTEGTTSGSDGSGLGKNSTLSSTDNQADSNSTVSTKVEDAESNSGQALTTYNNTLSAVNSSIEDSSQSSSMKSDNATEAEESKDTNDGTDDGALQLENSDEVQHDPIDSSDSSIGLEEKEFQTDLETQTEESNNEDAAAE
ncbi:hypothetical protein ACH5RR_002126 [Cinchona calisaya]|uniref:Uncharacterized protein n=1 Tax=Cinchona calisaya TaxID=153742 RepID=A0ABD3B5Y4_9GENT